MTETPAPAAPASVPTLAERARAAAARRTVTDDPIWQNPRWLKGAHRAAGRLAFILGVLPDRIRIEPSPVRRYGGWPWPELTLEDTGQRFRFIAAYCDPYQITALELCPLCESEVPTFPIRTLADLGDLITGQITDNDVDLSPAFDQDPGHTPDCPHAAPTPTA